VVLSVVYPNNKAAGISLLHCLWNKEEIITEAETVVASINKRGSVSITLILRRNHCYSREAMSITYAECVSIAIVSSREKRMRLIVLSSVASLTLPFFLQPHDIFLGGEKKLNIICVILIFATILFKTFLIRRRI